jgi:Xaa-Pro dipeptidase
MVNVLDRVGRVFKNVDADVLLVANTNTTDPNFVYLTGFPSGSFEGTFIIVKKKGIEFIASELEYEIARENAPKGIKVTKITSRNELRKIISEGIKNKKVGMNYSFVPHSLYARLTKLGGKGTSFVDSSKAFATARLVKDDDEIMKIRKAASITKEAIASTKASLKVGMTEEKVAAMINWHMADMGAAIAFDSIVSFDSNTALPHHMPDKTRLKENSIVLFDVGARYMNYCGDITRTFMFKPNVKSRKHERFKDIYRVVANAQSLALGMIKEGVLGSNVHKAAADHINKYNGGIYSGRFIHSLGHSLGIEVHDGMGLAPSSTIRLKRNMVMSDEPGIYITGFGGVRIEDDVLVGKASSSFL